jgi:transposase
MVDENGEPVADVFDEIEAAADAGEVAASVTEDSNENNNEDEPDVTVPAYTRKRGKRSKLPEDLPRRIVTIDVPDSEKICPHDGTKLTQMGYDSFEKLESVPASMTVVETRCLKFGCATCKEHVVKAANKEPDLFPKSFATPSLLATIAIAKFVNHLPLYRQEGIFKAMGFNLTRGTMARWVI